MKRASLTGIRACVFDAYGTLFDVDSSARAERERLGEAWKPLADLWRLKQLQYTWLRGLGERHADFGKVTGDALDYAMAALGIADTELRARLMRLYLSLQAYPEVPDVVRRLRQAGLRLAILSNGTPAMLASAVEHAGLEGQFEAVLSVEEVGRYKPHPAVYRLAATRLGLEPASIAFVSSNGWDACAAQSNGLRALWCNRSALPAERVPEAPEREMRSLTELPALVLGAAQPAGHR